METIKILASFMFLVEQPFISSFSEKDVMKKTTLSSEKQRNILYGRSHHYKNDPNTNLMTEPVLKKPRTTQNLII